jgi:hypothetical protein
LEEVHDIEFDETQGSQNEAQNLDDVSHPVLKDKTRSAICVPRKSTHMSE